MAIETFSPLLALSPFKGLDYTTAGYAVEPGVGVASSGANPQIIDGAITPERGRALFVALGAHFDSISVVTEGMMYAQDNGGVALSSFPVYVVGGLKSGTFVIWLYAPNTGSTNPATVLHQITGYEGSNLTYDRAVQYGGVMYFNSGFRLFLNQGTTDISAYDWTIRFWQYPPIPNGATVVPTDNGAAGTVDTTITTPNSGTTMVVASAAGISPGSRLVVGVGPLQEIVTVAAGGVVGTTITISGTVQTSTGATGTTFLSAHQAGEGVWAGLDAETVYYVVTRTTTMADGTLSETSVNLSQYALPPSFLAVAGDGVLLTLSGGLTWGGTHTDGNPYTSNLYRLSNLQPTWQFVANLTGSGTYVDISPDAAISGNVQLTPQRDSPPNVPGSYGVALGSYNYGDILIYKGRVWVYVIAQTTETNNVPEVQLWFSNDGRPWEFDQLTQVMLLDADVINQYANPTNNYTATYDSPYGNDPLGLGAVGTWLIAQSRRQTWAVIGDDSATFVPRLIFNIGMVSRHSGTDITGGRYWLSENGPYFFDGSAPKYIGQNIRGLLTSTPNSGAVAFKDQQQATGFFANMVWYLAFPTLGYTLGYASIGGVWCLSLPYAPAAAGAVSFTPAYPASYSSTLAGIGINEVVAARGANLDFWFADTSNDLGAPAPFSWSGAMTNCAKPSFEKQFRFVTLDSPPGTQGSAVATLQVDGYAPFVWTIPDLSTATRQITSVGGPGGIGELRGYMGQLSVVVTGVAGQPAPQVWGVTAWGTMPPERNLQIPV